jgi:ABC-type transporter Mla subunit MlaD
MADTPLIDRSLLETKFNEYRPPIAESQPSVPFRGLESGLPNFDGEPTPSALSALENKVLTPSNPLGRQTGGSISRTLAEASSNRYNYFMPGDYNNEDAYAQGQGWANKMVNGVGKGLVLTGTTLLQSTVGLVNGIIRWGLDGRFASLYDNEMNRWLDEKVVKASEDILPNYYKTGEREANWYSPGKLFSANFLWDGIVKNLGFAAGAALSGGAYATALKSIPLTARLFSIGKGAEAVAASEEALLAADKAASTYGKLKDLSNKFLSSYESLGKGGQITVAALGTVGEAGFEAYHNLNDFRNKKIQEYKDANGGAEPIGEDLAKINKAAEDIGNYSYFANVGLLTATNYIQFPKILGATYKGEKGIINSLTKEIGEVTTDATGKYIAAPNRFGKILSTLNKIRPYTFSASEAFEEGAQYAIGKSTENYYNKKYNNEPTSWLDSVAEGITQTFTTNEGMENILIGGLSGALMLAPGKYSEAREKAKNTQAAISEFNQTVLSDFTKELKDSVNRGTTIQEERETALRRGDVLESKDLERDYIINYLTPRIKYGRFDLVQSDIDSYKRQANTDFAELQAEGKALDTDTKEAYLQRLANLETTAENIKSLYQSLDVRYGGLVNENKKPVYSQKVMDQMIYAATKVADYDERIPQLMTILEGATGIDVTTMVNDLTNGQSESYIAAVEKVKASKSINKDELMQTLEDVAELSLRRENFLFEFNDIKNNPSKYDTAETMDETAPKKKTVAVKTKDGEEDIEVGTEYYLGRVVKYDKNDKEVYSFPRLTILGQNEDGTIKIKASNGVVKDISKDELSSYKLGKVSDTLNNKKARFFMENANTIYQFNFGKGNKVKGRLEYSPKEGILEFVYRDKKGKIKSIEVTSDQFVAKAGYDVPMIMAVGQLSAVQQETLKEFSEQIDDRTEAKKTTRLKILNELFDEVSKKLEGTKTLLQDKYSQFEKIVNQLTVLENKIKAGELTKTSTFKKSTNAAIKAANRLSRMQEQLRLEIADLEAEKEQLEFNQEYIADMAQNIDELPGGKDFLDELKEQKNNLEDLILETGKNINSISKLIDSVESALKTAVDFALDLIRKFESKYPNLPYTPTGLREFLNKDLELKGVYPDYQSYLQANPNLLDDLTEFERDIAEIDELDVVPNERSVAELREELENLYKQLNEASQQLEAKSLIVNKFQQVADNYKKQQEQEKQLKANSKLINAVIGTLSKEQLDNTPYSIKYEPVSKKGPKILVTSSIASKNILGYKRANYFGNKFNSFPNKDNIFGVLVTSANEDNIIPGLTSYLQNNNTDIDPTKTIALVMVEDQGGGKFVLVGQDGQPLSEDQDKLENAVFQVMPDESLQWGPDFGNETMFRSSTPEQTRKELKEQYIAWRNETLKDPAVNLQSITPSFGRPTKVSITLPDGKKVTDPNAAVSVKAAGLIEDKDLINKQLVEVPTLEKDISRGSTEFTDVLGRVFLVLDNAYVKLKNRKFNSKEATTIYQVLTQLSNNVFEDEGVEARSEYLIDWLRSVTFWGKPKAGKDPGYNSIWFERVDGELRLFFSGKGESLSFTPQAMEKQEGEITTLLQNMYNNVNARKVQNKDEYNLPYEEIIGIGENGVPQTKEWRNYQTYLLSDEGRTSNEIPLFTDITALESPEDTNRDGVYFTLRDAADNYTVTEIVRTVPKTVTPGGIKTKATQVSQEEEEFVIGEEKTAPIENLPNSKFVLDGKTKNIYVSPKGTKIAFTANRNLLAQGDIDNGIKILKGEDLAQAEEAIIAAGIKKEEIGRALKTPIANLLNVPVQKTTVEEDEESFTIPDEADADDVVIETEEETVPISEKKGFQGYKGGFEDKGKGTPEGDGKDVAMRQYVGNGGVIVELSSLNPSSSLTSFKQIEPFGYPKIGTNAFIGGIVKRMMLARNAQLSGKPLNTETKAAISKANNQGFEFVVGDMPGVDSQFIDYLQEIGAKFTVYHTGNKSRIAVATSEEVKRTPTKISVTGPNVRSSAIKAALLEDEEGDLREILEKQVSTFKPENWAKVEKWLKTILPGNLPTYRVKNVIKATGGRKAYGMYKKGAIYVYTNAEAGTTYHEVFHAIWNMFTSPKERTAIVNEFKSRTGSFTDRVTGQEIKYSEATPGQIKEQLAEEFREYVLDNKIPPKPTDGRPYIVKMFSELVHFIKTFFYGPQAARNTEELFKRIGEGYYKNASPYQSKLALAKPGIIDIEDAIGDPTSEYSLIANGLTGEQIHDTIQQMTYATLTNLIATNQSLFDIPSKSRAVLYKDAKDNMRYTVVDKVKNVAAKMIKEGVATPEDVAPEIAQAEQLFAIIDKNWDEITDIFEEQLLSYSIEFDDNDNTQTTNENNTGRGDYQDSEKIDKFKKANAAIKLLFATVPYRNARGKRVLSSINGVKLIPMAKVYIDLKNALYNSDTVDDMMEKLREFVESQKPEYNVIYERLTGQPSSEKLNPYTNIKTEADLQLITSFYNVMKGQAPDVVTVYTLPDGTVVTTDMSVGTASKQIAVEMENSIISSIQNNLGKYYTYDARNKVYRSIKRNIENESLGTLERSVAFMRSLGVDVPIRMIRKFGFESDFNKAVSGIKKNLLEAEEIKFISSKTIDTAGRVKEIAEMLAKIQNPDFESTYFNLDGDRVQSFIGGNAISSLRDFLTKINNKKQLVGSRYEYLLTDNFTTGSVFMDKIFDKESGDKLPKGNEMLTTAYAGGIIDESLGKRKDSSSLTPSERLKEELNLNLSGYYMNLVPGDASLDWANYVGNTVTLNSLKKDNTPIHKIFKEYFLSELAVSREDRKIVQDENETRKSTDLRFFKNILGPSLHNSIVSYDPSREKSLEDVYAHFESRINNAIDEFIKKDVERRKVVYSNYNILSEEENGWNFNGIEFEKKKALSENDVNLNIKYLSVNYMINNIELHKLVYSDPYFYKDELKRIKSFLSPRQAIIYGSAELNAAMNSVYNEGYDDVNDLGYTEFTDDYFKTITLEDVKSIADIEGFSKEYTSFKETDGAGLISMKAYRNFRIRASNWNPNEERQYRYDIAFEKKEKGKKLSAAEVNLLEAGNPQVKSAYTPLKPIVAGAKMSKQSYNDVVLDKFALYPLSFRVLYEINKDSNAIKLYDKMQEGKIDYAVFDSGRKVGADKLIKLYDKEGNFNNKTIKNTDKINIPFSIISVQSEVPSKDESFVTRGSQITKLVTLDFLQAGVPFDFMSDEKDFNKRLKAWEDLKDETAMSNASPFFKELLENQNLLEEMTEIGYENLLNKLGIKQTKQGFEIIDPEKIAQTLRSELFKREVNRNIVAALVGFEKGQVLIEASPIYSQVRNILYSIVDKNIVRPKINGGLKVQIPSTLFESVRPVGKNGLYESDVLKFYEKGGERVAEVMVGRWFDSDMSDEELLKYLNDTDEGKALLKGVAFRIPTQKQNSVDVIKIAKFLPKEFGDSVVVPAALVQKVGSDFDIDKLSMYFKNIYKGKDGKPKAIPYFGMGKDAIKKFEQMFDRGEFLNPEQLQELDRYIAEEKVLLEDLIEEKSNASKLITAIVGNLNGLINEAELTQEFTRGIKAKDQIINLLYKKSIENQYIQSLENIIGNEANYNRLVTPNSAKLLKDTSIEIVDKLGLGSFDYSSTDNMLNQIFMSRLRQAFVRGKYAIGLAAVAQTNHAQNQRSNMYIDRSLMYKLSKSDQKWLGDGIVKFGKYNTVKVDGRTVPSLSGIKDANNKYDISDIIGQFIDGYVDIAKGPWIMELGANPNVAPTWLFLVKIGVPIKEVAYFMNQPIIRDYVRELENSGYTWLFNDSTVSAIKESEKYKVDPSKVQGLNSIPNITALEKNIGKKSFDVAGKAEQQFILNEFLKYGMMANQLFKVIQGSNFDTTAFNDPMLIFKKEEQLSQARETIISSVDNLLNNSFVGRVRIGLRDSRNAIGQTALTSDTRRVRAVLQSVLRPYVNMPDRQFVKLARKAVNDLFDWAVQINPTFKINMERDLLSKNGTAKQITDYFNAIKTNPNHALHNNVIVNSLAPKFSGAEEEERPNNLYITGKDNKVYDQNKMIYGFEELRNYMDAEGNLPLYKKLVKLAILQSGLSTSPISFTSLIPYDDFVEEYNEILSRLEILPNLEDFAKLNVFERNNWNDDEIVPHKKAKWKTEKQDDGKLKTRYDNGAIKILNNGANLAMRAGTIPQVIKISTLSRESTKDIIVYSWEEVPKGKTRAEMVKAKDFSFIKKGLFKKVTEDGVNPLITYNKKGYEFIVYKAINAWGDSFRANEFYDVAHKSKIDNGFMKVNEVDDRTINSAFMSVQNNPPTEASEIDDVLNKKDKGCKK